ncbi:MAG: SMP-30/gluconolactonase/LRE family protein [Armatimonadetes bacterium]|nr:SMP-30/gluconolactonase/LRE family protein [Armatimonadota bacterium]
MALMIPTPIEAEFQSLDPRFDALFPKDRKVELLASGFKFTEGPIWVKDHLVFSDIPGNALIAWHPNGKTEVVRDRVFLRSFETGQGIGPNGSTLDRNGRIVSMEHGNRCITRWEKDGTKTILADRFEGKRFNSPNDCVFGPNGDLYFTDPTWGLAKGKEDPSRELDYCGIFRLTTEGKVHLLAKDLLLPNGLAFSPDGKKLYVSDSDPSNRLWMEYEMNADGNLGKSKVLYDGRKDEGPGLPDGLKVDVQGNIWAGALNGLQVIAPDGKLLGRVRWKELPANLCFGDSDGKTLYLTASTGLYRIKLNVEGIRPKT